MAKTKVAFFCQHCGYESPKWLGKCPSCGQWNSFVEEIIAPIQPIATEGHRKASHPISLQEVNTADEDRIPMPDDELNRVLGGGLVRGSLVLLAGEPGIGKSTLLLQTALQLPALKVLYISGEESEQQIRMRANRIGLQHPELYLLTETNMQAILKEARQLKPDLILVDSVQTLVSPLLGSPAGSIGQIRECAAIWQEYAKSTHTPVILVGHITKDGLIAGPKILEHIVDSVLQFEGDRQYVYRLLRTVKNRFGASFELGVYEMNERGLTPVSQPSALFMHQKEELLSGSAIASTLEGIRPLLVEVQALVTPSLYGTPQRTVSGMDLRRLQLLLAVLEKRGGFRLHAQDVFVNIVGGLRIEDPALDLAVIAALLSSFEDFTIPPHSCFAGEIGLSGEIRAVSRPAQRIAEAARLGFRRMYLSRYNQDLPTHPDIELIQLGKVEELYQFLFQR
ncbi:MAG: DNA repair protein RadA [Thermoflavifilum sp.]|nr:DNA repair protein RadA [Thermoflavifilum sp.]